MQCPKCREHDTIQIEIRLKEEETVQFFSCRRCEGKWWQRDGDTIELDQFLDWASTSHAKK